MSQARIGRVRFKAGGAVVRVIRRDPINPGGEDWRGKIVEHARTIAGYDAIGTELVGYYIIGMYANGMSSTAMRRDPDKCRIPRRLWPAYIEETVREHLITEPAANDEAVKVFNNQWVPK